MKKRIILALSLLMLVSAPAYAVFNERTITKTISVLKQELKVAFAERRDEAIKLREEYKSAEAQHLKMVEMTEKCNELALVLYSQGNNYTFDITYALNKVSEEYADFNTKSRPHIENIAEIDIEIERCQKLIESLSAIPPVRKSSVSRVDSAMVRNAYESLVSHSPSSGVGSYNFFKNLKEYESDLASFSKDSTDTIVFMLDRDGSADRDTCMALANAILISYKFQKARIIRDDKEYAQIRASLDSAYTYAMDRYAEIQDNIYRNGQDNYFKVLSNFNSYHEAAKSDLKKRYATRSNLLEYSDKSEWGGFVVLSAVYYVTGYILAIALLTYLILLLFSLKFKKLKSVEFKRIRPLVVALTANVLVAIMSIIAMMGPMGNFAQLAGTMLLIFQWLVIAILFTVLVGFNPKDHRLAIRAFLPILLLGAFVMFCRMLFVSDKILNLILFPTLLIFFVYQAVVCSHISKKLPDRMVTLQRVSLTVIGIATLIALCGYVLMSLQMMLWWTLQLSCLATLYGLHAVMLLYKGNGLKKKMASYKSSHKMNGTPQDGDFIRVTWLYDFIERAVRPVVGISSVLLCVWFAAQLFDLGETCKIFFYDPFIDLKNPEGVPVLQISLYKLVVVASLFYVFKYLNYLIKSLYRVINYEKVMKSKGRDVVRRNEVNLTLANNVIGILTWGLFILYSIYTLKIPVGALSAVFAGLAAGIGLALKDVLNNFIYGMQLMSGRLRVGDIVECDGVRGTVDKISYQSTEIQTLAGPVISFTNTNLFNQSFQNITKNTPYEYLKIPVCISYSSDFDMVRDVLTEALKPKLEEKDKFGRFVVEQTSGIRITFGEFMDSSVTVAIKQNVLSEKKWSYTSEINELVFKLFREKGIEIPFNQQEILIHNFPKEDKK